MKQTLPAILIAFLAISFFSCSTRSTDNKESNAHPSKEEHELAEFVNKIRVVDNHAHPNSIDPDDKGSDALPLDGLGNIQLPVRLRPESALWLDAARKVYGYSGANLNEKSRMDLADTAKRVMKE